MIKHVEHWAERQAARVHACGTTVFSRTLSVMKPPILPTIVFLAAVAVALPQLPGQSPAHTSHDSKEMAVHNPGNIKWEAGPPSLPPGAKRAILEGDSAKKGPFVMRLQMPDGYHIPPHTHPATERVTVISGELQVAMGEKLERSTAHKLTAGTYGYWPAGMKHAAWAKGTTILQVHGTGPWAINYLNPADDPRNAKKSQ